MLKYIAYIKNSLLTEIYKECGELYNSGVDFIIREISKDHDLNGTVVCMEFTQTETHGRSDSLENLINKVFSRQFYVKHDPYTGLVKLHIEGAVIAPLNHSFDSDEYL